MAASSVGAVRRRVIGFWKRPKRADRGLAPRFVDAEWADCNDRAHGRRPAAPDLGSEEGNRVYADPESTPRPRVGRGTGVARRVEDQWNPSGTPACADLVPWPHPASPGARASTVAASPRMRSCRNAVMEATRRRSTVRHVPLPWCCSTQDPT